MDGWMPWNAQFKAQAAIGCAYQVKISGEFEAL
jgi:hypothetical protein